MDHSKTLNISFALFLALLGILLLTLLLFKNPEDNTVLLSFDVEPVDGEDEVRGVLEILQRNNISATFFVTGEYALQYPEVIRTMTDHEIGCHSYSHPVMTKLTPDVQLHELVLCKEAIKNTTGRDVYGFRAPYHRMNSHTLDALESEGFQYDATIIDGLAIWFPRVSGRNIGEIPVSSIAGLPLEDVIWTYYLKISPAFYYILANKQSGFDSYVFHPHHVMRNPERFETSLKDLKERNTMFITHIRLIKTHYGGV